MKLELSRFQAHAHRCARCKTVWAHDAGARAEAIGFGRYQTDRAQEENVCYAVQYSKSHDCPSCGLKQTVCANPIGLKVDFYWDGNEKKEWKDYLLETTSAIVIHGL